MSGHRGSLVAGRSRLHVLLNGWWKIYERACNLCFVSVDFKLNVVTMSVLREALLLCYIQSRGIRALGHRLFCADARSLVLVLSNSSLDYLLALIDFLVKILLSDL